MLTLIMCVCVELCLLFCYMHIYVYRYEGVEVPDDKTGMYHGFHLLCLVFIYC